LYVQQWLFGSIRDDLTPSERGAWVDFLAIAYMDNREGRIVGGANRVRRISNTPWRTLQSTIRKCLEGPDPRLKEEGADLVVLSWSKYALTERQRDYHDYERDKDRKRPQKADKDQKRPNVGVDKIRVDKSTLEKSIEEENRKEEVSENYGLSFLRGLRAGIPGAYYDDHYLRAAIIPSINGNEREMTIVCASALSAEALNQPRSMKRTKDILRRHVGPEWELTIKGPEESKAK